MKLKVETSLENYVNGDDKLNFVERAELLRELLYAAATFVEDKFADLQKRKIYVESSAQEQYAARNIQVQAALLHVVLSEKDIKVSFATDKPTFTCVSDCGVNLINFIRVFLTDENYVKGISESLNLTQLGIKAEYDEQIKALTIADGLDFSEQARQFADFLNEKIVAQTKQKEEVFNLMRAFKEEKVKGSNTETVMQYNTSPVEYGRIRNGLVADNSANVPPQVPSVTVDELLFLLNAPYISDSMFKFKGGDSTTIKAFRGAFTALYSEDDRNDVVDVDAFISMLLEGSNNDPSGEYELEKTDKKYILTMVQQYESNKTLDLKKGCKDGHKFVVENLIARLLASKYNDMALYKKCVFTYENVGMDVESLGTVACNSALSVAQQNYVSKSGNDTCGSMKIFKKKLSQFEGFNLNILAFLKELLVTDKDKVDDGDRLRLLFLLKGAKKASISKESGNNPVSAYLIEKGQNLPKDGHYPVMFKAMSVIIIEGYKNLETANAEQQETISNAPS